MRFTKKEMALLLAILMILSFVSTTTRTNAESLPTGIASANMYYTDQFTITSRLAEAQLLCFPKIVLSSPEVGVIDFSVSSRAYDVLDKLGYKKLELQRWFNGSWMSTLTRINEYEYDTDSFLWHETRRACASNSYYRVVVEFYAENGDESQTMTLTTNHILCK